MGLITYTREAKCKDCAYIEKHTMGTKKKVHKCSNIKSKHYCQFITLNTPVCGVWALEKEE